MAHTFPRLSDVGSSKEKMTPQSCSFSLKSSSRLLGGASRSAGSSRSAEGGLPTCGKPPWCDPVALPAAALVPLRLRPARLPVTLPDDDDEAERPAGGWSVSWAAMTSCAPLGMERDWRFLCFSAAAAGGAAAALDASAAAGGADTATGAGTSLCIRASSCAFRR